MIDKKEIIEVSPEIKEDHIITVEDAATLKGVSEKAIYEAIKRGDLVKVNGVTLKSLKEYTVMKGRKKAGRIRMQKKKKNDLKIAKEVEKGRLKIVESEEDLEKRRLEMRQRKIDREKLTIDKDLGDLRRIRDAD